MNLYVDLLTARVRALAVSAVAATFLVLTIVAPPARAGLEVVEGAAEVSALTLKASTRQTVYAAECDSCPTLTLSIGAQTVFYDGRRPVALADVALRERGATVFFNPDTFKVTRVLFWP